MSKFICLYLFLSTVFLYANEYHLIIHDGKLTKSFTHKKLSLLATKQILANDPVYKGKIKFQSIEFSQFFPNIDRNKSFKFEASDGFTSIIAAKYFLDNSVKAYLAIETNTSTWPRINNIKTAGPVYLVWETTSNVTMKQEQWPFQIQKISIVENVDITYEKLKPKSLSASAQKGFEVFSENCFVCHRLNGLGEGTMGPDLNNPMNPTEYFQPAALRRFIRNPKSVRSWKGMKMPSFDNKTIDEEQLTHLINYLQEIKTNK